MCFPYYMFKKYVSKHLREKKNSRSFVSTINIIF